MCHYHFNRFELLLPAYAAFELLMFMYLLYSLAGVGHKMAISYRSVLRLG